MSYVKRHNKSIALIIILIGVLLVTLIGPMNVLRGKKKDSTIYELPKYQMLNENDGIVTQQFSPRYAHLRGLRLVLLNAGEGINGNLVIDLADSKGKRLYSYEKKLNELPAGEWVDIDLKWKLKPGNSYDLSISAIDTNQLPVLFAINGSFDVEENTVLYQNGNIVDGGLAIGYLYYESYSALYRLIVCALILSIVFLSVGYLLNQNFTEQIRKYCLSDGDLDKRIYYAVMFVMGVFILFIHTYKLAEIPYGINVDEMGMGYDAYCLANYGVDRYLMSWPVYFINWGSGQNALYTFMAAILIKIFGYSLFVLRIPAVINGFIIWISGCYIVYSKWEKRFAIVIFTIFYTILPNYLLYTRFGLESLLMLGFSTLFFAVFLFALKRQKWYGYILTGIVGGVMLYTYAIAYVTTILFLIVYLIYLFRIKKIKFSHLFLMGVAMGILAFPLIMEQLIHIFDWPEFKIGIFTVPRMPYRYRGGDMNFRHVPEDFLLTLGTIFWHDDSHYCSFPQFLTMYWISIPVLVLGIIYDTFQSILAFIKKEWEISNMVITWFWVLFFAGCIMGGKGPNCFRLNGIYFVTTYLLITGLWCIYRGCKKSHVWFFGIENSKEKRTHEIRIKSATMRSVMLFCCVVYIICFSQFIEYYFYRYQKDYYPEKLNWNTYTDAIDTLNNQGSEISQRITYVSDIKAIYTAASLLPSPYDYKYDKEMKKYLNYRICNFSTGLETIDYNANYIIFDTEKELPMELERVGFTVQKSGNHYVCWNNN